MKIRSVLTLLLTLGIATPLVGCDMLKGEQKKTEKSDSDDEDSKKKKKKKKQDEEDEEEEASAKPSASASSAPPPPPTASATATASDAAPTASASAPPPPPAQPTIPGRSALPSQEDWTLAPEISVAGSSSLGCETKGVREWVRVSCKGNDPQRGAATGVNITRGGGKGDTFTLVSGGVASLVYPYYEGQDLLATFLWENTTSELAVAWPRGAPKPPVYGIFATKSDPKPVASTSTKKEQCAVDTDCPRGSKCAKRAGGGNVCVVDGTTATATATTSATTSATPRPTGLKVPIRPKK
jgi:hypothetical protein